MAERLEITAMPKRTPIREPLYDKYFDGSVWRLTLGVDSRSTNFTHVRTGIYDRARRLGIRVSVHRESDTTLLVQAVPR